MEGALKIKEMCNIRTEGYIVGDLKHWPSINSNDTPMIILIFDDEHASHMRTVAMDVSS